MAYVSQEMKANMAPAIKAILKKYNLKGSLSVQNHSRLLLTLKSGAIDFIGNYIETDVNSPCAKKIDPRTVEYIRKTNAMDVNVYWYDTHFSGVAKECIAELVEALKGPEFFDNSDIQTDYFSCSHYYGIAVGKYQKPYQLTA